MDRYTRLDKWCIDHGSLHTESRHPNALSYITACRVVKPRNPSLPRQDHRRLPHTQGRIFYARRAALMDRSGHLGRYRAWPTPPLHRTRVTSPGRFAGLPSVRRFRCGGRHSHTRRGWRRAEIHPHWKVGVRLPTLPGAESASWSAVMTSNGPAPNGAVFGHHVD